ncbi:unnamed protein product [Blepharisma stoltei]|uniref:PHD and RING finger domain-containing protein 1 n=1 Tax=Blepharisma stoltei TaxID=1481888 RepID=A0AAU9I9E5_9CILI|nr:unnamed protein product [Blepharisma stoltei]
MRKTRNSRKIAINAQKDRCLICLEPLENLIKVSLDTCGHNQFCIICITRWSEITNKCPLCNERYHSYINLSSFKLFFVEDKDQSDGAIDDPYRDLACQICHLSNDEENLLLCDSCNKGFHISCINLSHIPILEEWFCKKCIKKKSKTKQMLQAEEMKKASKNEKIEEIIVKKRISGKNVEVKIEMEKVRRSGRIRKNKAMEKGWDEQFVFY